MGVTETRTLDYVSWPIMSADCPVPAGDREVVSVWVSGIGSVATLHALALPSPRGEAPAVYFPRRNTDRVLGLEEDFW